MTILYSLGEDPNAFYSQSASSLTQDGLDWTSASMPFSQLGFVRSAAVSTSTESTSAGFVALSTQNQYAVCQDPQQSWTSHYLDSSWCLTKIQYTNTRFSAVGFVKNPTTLLETALITNFSQGAWTTPFASTNAGSVLLNLVPGPLSQGKPSWIAVGAKDKLVKPMMVVSNDSGLQWNEINLTQSLPGPICSALFDISTVPARVWVGGTGWIASALWTGGSSIWSVNDIVEPKFKPRTISTIKSLSIRGQKYRLALSGSTVFVGQGQNEWVPYDFPGVNFSDVVVFKDKLYLSTWGMLTNTTGFSGTFDNLGKLVLEPFGNSVSGHVLLTV